MKRRLKATIIGMLAVLLVFSAASADPARLSSIKNDYLKKPTLIAQDSQGNLYVSETSLNRVRIFDLQDHYLRTLLVEQPLGLAVDASGSIYVCSEKKKRIEVYNADLTLSRILGDTQGDVRSTSISIDALGNIYVVDNFNDKMVRHDTVNVYDSADNFLYSFGSTGSSNGLFNQPTGLAINEALGEIYVVDNQIIQTASGLTSGARIQVFDLGISDVSKRGQYLRTLPIQYGATAGQITTPVGLSIDQTGKLYVVDSYQRAVLMFDAQTGVSYGALYDMAVPLQIPLGVTIGADNIARVTSYGGASVEKYDVGNCVTMEIQTTSLPFVAQQYSMVAPDPLPIRIKNSCSGTLSWTASTDQPWIIISSATGTTGPNSTTTLLAGVANVSNLIQGTHTGAVIVKSAALYNVPNSIPVTLKTTPALQLIVNPGWLDFRSKRGKKSDPQTINVELQNAVNPFWSVQKDLPAWLAITPSSGATTSAVVSVNTAILPTGTYTPNITFLSPSVAIGGNSKLRVNIQIDPLTRITVTTNRPDASFSLLGSKASYTGSGLSWSTEDAIAGDYVISYNTSTGYRKPRSQTMTLPADSEITFIGTYVSWSEIAARKNIITARGPWIKNDALIKTYKVDGSAVMPDFTALDSKYGANIAVGDVDGDGTSEIIVGTGAGPNNTTLVRIYKSDRATLLTSFEAFPGMRGGVNVAVADFDGDGKAEIIVAPAGGAENPGIVKIFAYDNATKSVIPTGVEFTAHESLSGVNLAAADIEGNYAPRLVTAPVSGTQRDPGAIKIWKIDGIQSNGTWTVIAPPVEIALLTAHGATLAAGDTDGDGKDEIIAGIGSDTEKALVKIFKDGNEIKRIPVFDGKYGVNVASADLDGDGIAEIIVGIGPDPVSQAGDDRDNRKNKKERTIGRKTVTDTVRIYSATGIVIKAFTSFEDSRYGVKVAVGDLGL